MAASRKIVDCHVHLGSADQIANLAKIGDAVGLERMSIVCCTSRDAVNANPSAFAAKAAHPERFYVFAGLDHSAYFSGGKVQAPALAEQVDRLIALGADGIKMIENKPTTRKALDVAVDGDYFAEYFARAEETGFPILWHVNDPEEFWDPKKTPSWARKRGWGYDKTFIAKEPLYAEVERVLARHPKLRIVFAHFYFLSADLPRAAALFDKYPGVHFDLAPGIEFLYNMSRNVEAAREFFVTYADRIVFGTDISGDLTVGKARIRAGIVTRWLETGDTYRVSRKADFLLGPPEDGVMRGLSLPAKALDRICRRNFERIAGRAPRRLDKGAAREECLRIAAEMDALKGSKVRDSHAAKAAARLAD